MKGEEFKEIKIPKVLFEKLEKEIRQGEKYNSVSGYVTDIIRKFLAEKLESKHSLSKEEEEQIKERLKSLGYLE